jgi:hypothetical protein
MAPNIRASEGKALREAFDDNVEALRDLIYEAEWENDTLMDTAQQRFSKYQTLWLSISLMTFRTECHSTCGGMLAAEKRPSKSTIRNVD